MEQTTLTVRSLTAQERADDDKRERQLTTRPPFYDIISRARVVIIIRLHATRGGRNRWIIGGSETGACAGCGGGGGGGVAGDDRSRSRAIRRALPVLPARRRAPPCRRVPRLASPGNDDTGTGIAEREPESYFGLDNAHDGPRTSVAGPCMCVGCVRLWF